MRYKSLQTTDLLNQTETTDANNVTIYKIDASQNWTSESIDVSKGFECQIISESMTGTGGTLTYNKSLDKINYTSVKQGDGVTAVTYTISSNAVQTLQDFRCLSGYRNFSYTKGSVTVGTITIKVYNE